MNVTTQLSLLNGRTAEPIDGSQGRWTDAQKMAEINAARRIVAEETRCFPVKDSQTLSATAVGSTTLVSVANDFIGFLAIEYDGRPLRCLRPGDWRDVVGTDDTVQGDPTVVTYFARQFQIFPNPNQGGKTLLYRGWAYPADLTVGGADAQFTDKAADTALWLATSFLKANDERSTDYSDRMVKQGIEALKKQYMPNGPRYINSGDIYLPWGPML